VRRQQDDRDEVSLHAAAERVYQRVTVGVRHHEIAHDDVGKFSSGNFAPLCTIGRFEYLEARCEMLANVCAQIRAVVNNQQSWDIGPISARRVIN